MKRRDLIEITEENVDALVEQYADTWMIVSDLCVMFRGVYRQQFDQWSKSGRVRRQKVIPVPQRGGRYEYNVADVIVARHTTKTIKPFKRRVENGIEIACCNMCDEWKPATEFYPNPAPGKKDRIHTHCKTCHVGISRRAYRENPDARAKSIARSRLTRIRRQEAKRAAEEWQEKQKRVEIPAKQVADFIERNHVGVPRSELGSLCGLHEDTIRKVISQARKGRNIKLATADAILTNLGGEVLLAQIHNELEMERPQWHHEHPYCSRCLRTSVAYAAQGMCHTCYINRNDPDYEPIMEKQWARRHVCCKGCGTTKRRHYGLGLCNACWQKARRVRRKLEAVGSGHGNL